RRRHTRFSRDWSSDVCSSDLHELRGDGEVRRAGAAERRGGEDAGAERADEAADAMDPEDVSRVVIAEPVLHNGDEEVADRRDDRSEERQVGNEWRAGGSARHE